MTRIQFIQSIDRTNSNRTVVDDVTDYFDHEMLLYDLIGSTNSKISIIENSSGRISFQIDSNKTVISNLNSLIGLGQTVIEYERPLELHQSMISDKSINLTIAYK